MNFRAKTTLLFFVTGFSFLAGLAWLLAQFAMPRPDWVEIGKASDYPPADEPYAVYNPEHVYLLNDGQRMLVLEPLNQLPGAAPVRWNTTEQAFIDPGRGTQFNKYGIPIRRHEDSLWEEQSLPRYPLKISGEMLYFDRSRPEITRLGSQTP